MSDASADQRLLDDIAAIEAATAKLEADRAGLSGGTIAATVTVEQRPAPDVPLVNAPPAQAPDPAPIPTDPLAEPAPEAPPADSPAPDTAPEGVDVSPSAAPRFPLGLIHDTPDDRDYALQVARGELVFPPSVSLRYQPGMPAIYNQGQVGSCTGDALARLIEFWRAAREMPPAFKPSALFLYYNARDIEGTADFDAGAQLRDVLKGANKKGACGQSTWLDVPDWVATRPIPAAYFSGAHHLLLSYYAVPRTIAALKENLHNGHPVLAGIAAYAAIFDAPDGDVPDPTEGETPEGGHAIVITGYDDDTQRVEFANSWGEGWGKGGYGTLSYAYVTNAAYATALWTIRGLAH